MTKKIKILTLSDHPLSPSGVGTQTKYICEALLRTGKYSILSLGGAIKHADYRPIKVNPYGDDWKIIPVDGYGTQEIIRSILSSEKPDVVWLMTDPRFWDWLWMMEDEIRTICPVVYYHVWDNYPPPMFNRPQYLSNDHIACISKLTHDIVKKVAPEVPSKYIPHAVDQNIFRPFTEKEKHEAKNLLEDQSQGETERFTFFWNNRNARRKQSGTLIYWFKDFLDKVGPDKARLIMHTDPHDVHGQDLNIIAQHLGLSEQQIMFSTQKLDPTHLAALYNMADCTINISDAEGFGLSTLESLSCGVPIIVNMTGGLQEQVTDGKEWFGIGLFPTAKSLIGSQQVPYIYEDRLDKSQVVSAMTKMYNLSTTQRKKMGEAGRQHVMNNYNFYDFQKTWVDFMDKICNEDRNYSNILFKEVA